MTVEMCLRKKIRSASPIQWAINVNEMGPFELFFISEITFKLPIALKGNNFVLEEVI